MQGKTVSSSARERMGSFGGGSTNSPCITVTKNRERHGSYRCRLLLISWKSWELNWFPISHKKRCTLACWKTPDWVQKYLRSGFEQLLGWSNDQTVKHCFSSSGEKLRWNAAKLDDPISNFQLHGKSFLTLHSGRTREKGGESKQAGEPQSWAKLRYVA